MLYSSQNQNVVMSVNSLSSQDVDSIRKTWEDFNVKQLNSLVSRFSSFLCSSIVRNCHLLQHTIQTLNSMIFIEEFDVIGEVFQHWSSRRILCIEDNLQHILFFDCFVSFTKTESRKLSTFVTTCLWPTWKFFAQYERWKSFFWNENLWDCLSELNEPCNVRCTSYHKGLLWSKYVRRGGDVSFTHEVHERCSRNN